MRPRFPLVFALLTLGMAPAARGQSSRILGEILLVEDRRAREEGDLAVLTGALGHPEPLVVRRAARAVGRLERPPLAERLFPLLVSRFPAVRGAAAEGIAQAAQGFRGDSSLDHRGVVWPALLAALRERLHEETDADTRGMLALSLGRLPYVDPGEIAPVRRALIDLCSGVRAASEANTRFCRGAESLVRSSWRRLPLEEGELHGLRAAVRSGAAAAPRRHALGALVAAQAADDTTLGIAVRARDAELRRLALLGVRRATGAWEQHPVLSRGLVDSAPAVRLEALRALARIAGEHGCPRINRATRDPGMVALVAIDLLSACGGDTAAVERLVSAVTSLQPATTRWHVPAHALVALARAAPSRAAALIPPAATHAVWQVRSYAARAAAAARDTVTLDLLASDVVPNVREAAITGLQATVGHAADPVYRRALESVDFQLVLTAAIALAGTPERALAAAALLAALDKLSLAQAETSRDTRVGILNRLREVGDAGLAARLQPFLADFDPAVADSTAAILAAWTGRRWESRPRPLAGARPVSPAEADSLRGARLLVVLEGGRHFEVALEVDEAPVTVVRIARLVKRRYYDGLTFHRVVPNFVVQGGGPGANEYSGAPAFMRDELSSLTHARGTLGISTRGRDTGDAQMFVNLRDNPRLDYDYTVWGRVVSGLAVVDGLREGDRILRAEIRSR